MNLPPISDRKIRFALVGCGRISKNHIAALAQHSDRAELVEVCDTNPESLRNAVPVHRPGGHRRAARHRRLAGAAGGRRHPALARQSARGAVRRPAPGRDRLFPAGRASDRGRAHGHRDPGALLAHARVDPPPGATPGRGSRYARWSRI